MKVGIIVIVYNLSTRVFILQMQTIKKFCQDDFTIEVVDNSSDPDLSEAIRHHASDQGVNYRKVISSTQDPSLSHAFAANLAYTKMKDTYDLMLFLDHDAIPVLPFSVEKILDGKVVGGMLSGHQLSYFWPGCLMLDNTKIDKSLVDFSPNNSLRYDTGGGTSKLKEKYGHKGCVYFDEVGIQNPHMINHPTYYFYMMICNGIFMHFIAASGWNAAAERNDERISGLIAIASEKIEQA